MLDNIKQKLKGKENWIILGAVVLAFIVGGIFGVVRSNTPSSIAPENNSSSSAAVSTATTGVVSASSSQQSIDTNLSLAPTSVPVAPASKPTPSAPLYAGCKLELAFGITSGSLNSSGNVGYTLAAKNMGSSACDSASISVYYANNESFASASPKATADGYYWQLGTLASGQAVNISLTTDRSAPLATGDGPNEACLSASNGVDACSNAADGASLPASSASPPAAAPAATPATAQEATTLSSGGRETGIWFWTPLSQMSAAQMQQAVNEASENNFNAIYITIDEYLNIAAMAPGAAQQQALATYEQTVSNFLALAAQKNIAVDAEAGSRDWGQPGDSDEAGEIMSFVAQYNSTHATKFRGVQYDIEPYLLPQYAADESGVLTNYIGLVSSLVAQDKSLGLPLTIIVPHFYDDVIQWTPEVTVDGVTNYPYEQILRLLSELPSARIIVMAYRNFSSGSDGSIDLSQTEVTEADSTNVKIIVAQETGPVTPSYVTFYGMTRDELFTQVDIIDQAFASDKSFGGIAVDYLDPFLELQ